jgi:pimeloyl-ACP methyl ester carboxylesterase
MSTTVGSATEIQPFRVEIPEAQIDDLRRRIAATRWPTKELVADRSQGVQLTTLRELARFWETDYDWRKVESKLNALPQFKTEIDGVEIHFIHVKSQHESALPLIMTHGWPGSVIELLETVGPLTDPAAHGGGAGDAFDLVLPSIPGYGFSGEPAEVGWAPRVAPAWAELMHRLGYNRYVAQGGDVGASITDAMGRLAPEGLVGIHTNLLVTGLGGGDHPSDTDEEKEAIAALATFRASGFGYFLDRPRATDDRIRPAGFARRPGGPDARPRHDSYYKISHAFVDGEPRAISRRTTSSTTSRCTG